MFPLGNSVISERKGKHFFTGSVCKRAWSIYSYCNSHDCILFYCVCHRKTETQSSQCDIFGFQADMLFNKSSNMCFPQGIKSGM